MPRERAALARSIFIFFAGLAAAGLLIAVLNDPFNTIMTTGAETATSSQAAQGRTYIQSYWDALPFIIVFLSLAQLLGAAAAERRLPGQ
ncbi:MAG: hypothetical protein RI560_05680 [Natronomonas sp.]|nr:hypothetical protein [Natronomonas sp.]